jgi:hypothetical protein
MLYDFVRRGKDAKVHRTLSGLNRDYDCRACRVKVKPSQ